MSRWKIFYTNMTSLSYAHPEILEDVTQIPLEKRVGVHSVIQEMEEGATRELIEQYHYMYLESEQQWIGVGIDGLLDYVANQFDNILCILHGRTMTSDGFRAVKSKVAKDQEIIGFILAARWKKAYPFVFKTWRPVHFTSGIHKDTYLVGKHWEDWVDISRHRMYAPEISEPGPYGEQRQY